MKFQSKARFLLKLASYYSLLTETSKRDTHCSSATSRQHIDLEPTCEWSALIRVLIGRKPFSNLRAIRCQGNFQFFFSRDRAGKLERSWERAAGLRRGKQIFVKSNRSRNWRPRKNHPSSSFTIRHQIDSHGVSDEMTNNGETDESQVNDCTSRGCPMKIGKNLGIRVYLGDTRC